MRRLGFHFDLQFKSTGFYTACQTALSLKSQFNKLEVTASVGYVAASRRLASTQLGGGG